jgi:peroxiredoxin
VRLEDFRGKNVVLVFYLGGQCVHCVEELAALAKRAEDFKKVDATILAVSADAPADLAKPPSLSGLDLRLLSDADHSSARRFRAWDDFEEIALHATILIDRQGRERWARVGGDPFDDAEFLLAEIRRWERQGQLGPVAAEAASPRKP